VSWHAVSRIAASVLLAVCAVGVVGADGGRSSASVESCNPVTGLAEPLPMCTEVLCDRPAPELRVEVVTWATAIPRCRTSRIDIRPFYDDGPPRTRNGDSGVQRFACLYEPPDATPVSKRPLVVWLHGGGAGSADNVYDATSIRSKAIDYDLTGDPERPGFFLLSVQGRSLRYPTTVPRDGHHHDFYYRDLGSPSSNPDIANVDVLIDELAASGRVDRQRIYVMGWSNGGFFSQMYAIARHTRLTPGGNRVAAAVAFTAADPFHNTREDQWPSCQLDPYPTSTVPILLVSRSCDIVACDEEQLDRFGIDRPAPGHVVATWQSDLSAKVRDPNVWRLTVTGDGRVTDECSHSLLCTPAVATLNHLRWPDGVADRSGRDHEPAMLDILRDHPSDLSRTSPRRPSGRRP
jgi:pimeloyl-ACP methyl ester carboxylesterase